MRFARTLTVIAAAALALVACGGGDDPSAGEPPAASTSATTSAPSTLPSSEVAAVTPRVLQPVEDLIATAGGDLAVYSSIGDDTPASTLPAQTPFGSPMTVRVVGLADEGTWLEVILPTRPNGSRAFVRAADVELTRAEYAIDIDLATRTMRVFGPDDAVIVETTVAIGSPENPTPTGATYVTDLLDTGNANGAYGPFALGLALHSTTLSEFAGGDGQIGIHGTNQPSSVGKAVSHGCVRVPNDVVTQLAHMLPLGTPVTIH